jgi:3'(2'), 5'-bisphosphate nucleotidase
MPNTGHGLDQQALIKHCVSAVWLQQVHTLATTLITQLMAYHDGRLPLDVQHKFDGSPVTSADLAAHRCIAAALEQWLPGVPLISEEAAIPDFAQRRHWPRYWLVDPLDGTRDFMQKTAEFSVNIALIDQQRPLWGLLILPAQQQYYFGGPGVGVYCHDFNQNMPQTRLPALTLSSSGLSSPPLGLAISRYQSLLVQQRQANFIAQLPQAVRPVPCSGAVKFADLLHGRAHLYPRFSSICEWDVAAGDALLNGLGGLVVDAQLNPYRYNQQDSVQQACFFAMSHAQLLQPAGAIWQAQVAGFSDDDLELAVAD